MLLSGEGKKLTETGASTSRVTRTPQHDSKCPEQSHATAPILLLPLRKAGR